MEEENLEDEVDEVEVTPSEQVLQKYVVGECQPIRVPLHPRILARFLAWVRSFIG